MVGILHDDTPTLSHNFENVTGTLAASHMVSHVQSRPTDQKWQYYYVAFPFPDSFGNLGEIMVGVSTTGEQIQNDGRVYAGDAVSSTTVELPSFTQLEFEEVKGTLKYISSKLTILFCAKLHSPPCLHVTDNCRGIGIE